ncbi:MAG: Glycotrans4-likeN domain-containing protein [Nitrospira sp.]|nr:MAG: Glycotrans4-likeN domain-containing protein [Nitrospira sp.]
MKPTILMFCPQFRPRIGGAERQAEKLTLALAATGCKITVLTPRFDLDSPDKEEGNGVTIERFPLINLSQRYPFPCIALLNIPYILWQVVRAVKPRLKGVDLLHAHIASLLTAGAALAGRLAGIPVLCKVATAAERSDLGKIENTGGSGRLVAWLVRSLVGTWVATTNAVREALITAGIDPQSIIRIPNGVTVPDESGGGSAADMVRRILYLGRLSTDSQRDIPTLIKAFDLLASTYPDMELAIVGDGDQFEETKRLTGNCLTRHRIHLPGFDCPEKWLAWAHCFVLPSRREGLSNALLEAMAAGLPCIANDIPPNREVLADGEAGILVPVGDVAALAQALRRIATVPGEHEHWRQRGRKRVEEMYSIDRIVGAYLQLYTRLLTNPAGMRD